MSDGTNHPSWPSRESADGDEPVTDETGTPDKRRYQSLKNGVINLAERLKANRCTCPPGYPCNHLNLGDELTELVIAAEGGAYIQPQTHLTEKAFSSDFEVGGAVMRQAIIECLQEAGHPALAELVKRSTSPGSPGSRSELARALIDADDTLRDRLNGEGSLAAGLRLLELVAENGAPACKKCGDKGYIRRSAQEAQQGGLDPTRPCPNCTSLCPKCNGRSDKRHPCGFCGTGC